MNNLVRFPQPASAQAQPPADADARANALHIRASFIVEAPAGSGKTGLLVQRLLKLLGDESVNAPEEVLAITFTRKATAEMQERVLSELQAAHDGVPLAAGSDFDRETRALAEAALRRSDAIGWDLLTQPQRLNIRSILSVCVALAHSRPLLLNGIGPLEPVLLPGPLYRLAARRTLLQLGGSDPALDDALRTLLLHRDGNLANCEALIATMLHTREQWGELIPLTGPAFDDAFLDRSVRPQLEQTLANIVCAGLQQALDLLPPGVLEYLTQFAHRFAGLPGHNGKPSPIAFCHDKHLSPAAQAEHLDHWRALIGLVVKPSDGEWRRSLAITTFGFKPPKPDLDHFKLFLTSIQSDPLQAALANVLALPSPAYPEEQWVVAKALFRVLRHALAELKLIFAERGECDFSEFALAAREALRSEGGLTSDLALTLGGQLRHLLVDEMQDTSSSQYALIEALTQSWDGRSQTLFLVGDPKQSIYLFRQARVERFLRTMREQQLGEIHLTALQLTANFRSQAELVDAFNHTFAPIFTSADVPFVAATPTRAASQPKSIFWHPAVLGEQPTGSAAADHAAQEALEIRRIIQQRLDLPLPEGRTKPWRIAVLARARGHLDAVVREFKAHDGKPEIAFRGIDLDPLNERPEVLDALALTRALLHPADRIAWLAVLRAPWCGLGSADLLHLTGDMEARDAAIPLAPLIAAHRSGLSDTGQRLLARSWPVLAAAIDTLGRTPLSVHVERTWRSLGGDAPLPPSQLTNVLRYFAVLRELEAESQTGRLDLATLELRLEKLYAAPRTGDHIRVDLLTIHKAKGLEWDVVLVPGLHRRPANSASELLNWAEFDAPGGEAGMSIALAPIWGRGADSDRLNDWLSSIRSRRERAEEKRLFYVACTRAREELHLFAALKRSASGELAPPVYNSLLAACLPAAAASFTELQTPPTSNIVPFAAPEIESLALAASAEPTVAAFPVLERLPHGFDPAARFASAATRRVDYPAAAALRHAQPYDRPEGSFAARAFGNVVHAYLQVLAERLANLTLASTLLAELPAWLPRLQASLRGQGLAPALAAREATRALEALTRTLADPVGLWLLSPHPSASSELTLTTPRVALEGALSRHTALGLHGALSLRIDRTFIAGPEPLAAAPPAPAPPCIWIVDFKTTALGARPDAAFREIEIAKYGAQIEAYAALRRSMPDGHLPIRLGLYYPLIPRLLHWPSVPAQGMVSPA